MSALFASLSGKLILGAVILALLGGGYALITTKAFNRGYDKGVAETTERMKKAIAEMTRVATQNQNQWQAKTPGEKTAELQKRCVAACQQEPKCEAACRQ